MLWRTTAYYMILVSKYGIHYNFVTILASIIDYYMDIIAQSHSGIYDKVTNWKYDDWYMIRTNKNRKTKFYINEC
jgi:hypothetical protein